MANKKAIAQITAAIRNPLVKRVEVLYKTPDTRYVKVSKSKALEALTTGTACAIYVVTYTDNTKMHTSAANYCGL